VLFHFRFFLLYLYWNLRQLWSLNLETLSPWHHGSSLVQTTNYINIMHTLQYLRPFISKYIKFHHSGQNSQLYIEVPRRPSCPSELYPESRERERKSQRQRERERVRGREREIPSQQSSSTLQNPTRAVWFLQVCTSAIDA